MTYHLATTQNKIFNTYAVEADDMEEAINKLHYHLTRYGWSKDRVRKEVIRQNDN